MSKRIRMLLTAWLLAASALVTALTLTTATFAWFSVNRQVETDRVTAAAGSAALELEISRQGGAEFAPGTIPDADGKAVNGVALRLCEKELMPVSTADLEAFVYCPSTTGENADVFALAEDDSLYYHDTIYLRARVEGMDADTKMALYLDGNAGKPIVASDDGKMLTAARLGLTFNQASPKILKLSDVDEGLGNTYLEGKRLAVGSVLGFAEGKPLEISQPEAVMALEDVLFAPDNPNRQPLILLEPNKVYRVDVYFYLEGCDPDCLSERVGLTQASMNLAFFGLLEQGGDA